LSTVPQYFFTHPLLYSLHILARYFRNPFPGEHVSSFKTLFVWHFYWICFSRIFLGGTPQYSIAPPLFFSSPGFCFLFWFTSCLPPILCDSHTSFHPYFGGFPRRFPLVIARGIPAFNILTVLSVFKFRTCPPAYSFPVYTLDRIPAYF